MTEKEQEADILAKFRGLDAAGRAQAMAIMAVIAETDDQLSESDLTKLSIISRAKRRLDGDKER